MLCYLVLCGGHTQLSKFTECVHILLHVGYTSVENETQRGGCTIGNATS